MGAGPARVGVMPHGLSLWGAQAGVPLPRLPCQVCLLALWDWRETWEAGRGLGGGRGALAGRKG